jgi:predicted AAA+ superfamily ATPase
VRQLGGVANLRIFELFLALCASRHGQEVGYASLAGECGVSAPTVKSWLGVLAASYVTVLLPPWFGNAGKRLTKSPRLYFVDPALACALTRQPSADAALAGPMGGALLEGLVVAETIKAFAELGQAPAMWFWRSADRLEVDLLVQTPAGLLAVEVKRTATPTPRHCESLLKVGQFLGDLWVAPGVVVCNVDQARHMPLGCVVMPWHEWPGWLRGRLTAQPLNPP